MASRGCKSFHFGSFTVSRVYCLETSFSAKSEGTTNFAMYNSSSQLKFQLQHESLCPPNSAHVVSEQLMLLNLGYTLKSPGDPFKIPVSGSTSPDTLI